MAFEFIAARQVSKLRSEISFTQVYQILNKLPQIECSFTVKGWWEGGSGTQEERYVDTSHEGTTEYLVKIHHIDYILLQACGW